MQGLDWLTKNPEIQAIYTGAADLNGIARGKRAPIHAAADLIKKGTRFPKSVLNLDVWGHDIEGSPLVLASGDQDGELEPTDRGFVPMPWLATPSVFLPLWMSDRIGTPFEGDPRYALAKIEKRFKNKKLQPVLAVELEFFLVDDSEKLPRAPASPLSGKRRNAGDILTLQTMEHFDGFFSDLYAACTAMDIPASNVFSEGAPGQFEMNLDHQASVLKAADDAWLFKMLVKGLARKHGMAASFMAKPYKDWAGNGLHLHVSLLDKDGRNIFDDGSEIGMPVLRHAIAGCLNAMSASTLIFAPHANSYARFVPGAHAPTGIAWAYENRTTAIRVPSGPPAARRIEHRVAGGDVNPYLSIAAVLGAMLNGMEDAKDPTAPITGNAYEQNLKQIPSDWTGAIDAFESSPEVKRIFPQLLIDNFVMTKRQESRRMAEISEAEQIALYLDMV